MALGGLFLIAISFGPAFALAAFAIYQYRRGATLTLKYGWLTRTEHPLEFWWGIGITAVMSLMFAAPPLLSLALHL